MKKLKLLVFLIFTYGSAAGCNQSPKSTSVREELLRPSKVSSGTVSTPQSEIRKPKSASPVATINGTPIDRAELINLLLESHGLVLLQQLLMREAAMGELKRLGLNVTDGDIEREYDLTLQADNMNGKDPDKLTLARKKQLIDDWTRTRGVGPGELDIAMHRQAALRKIAQGRLKITDEMLHAEYDRVHGEKAEVRHIQLDAPRFWSQLKERVEKGERFEELVTLFSQNNLSRQKLGLLPPFTRKDPSVPPVFSEVAFQLRPGEVSNLFESNGSFHVLKLERLIPPDNVSFEQERDHVLRVLTARLLSADMEFVARTLMNQSRITIEDHVLRDQYERAKSSGKISGPALAPAAP